MDVTGLQTIPETGHLFDFAKYLWRHVPQTGRIALVVRWDQSRLAKLLELLVRTVGVNLTVFVTREQAMVWILGHSHQPPAQRRPATQCIRPKGGSLCPVS